MTIYTIDRECSQMNFWREGYSLNIGSMDVDLNNQASIDNAKTVLFALLKELLENPELKEFRLEATEKKHYYKYYKFIFAGDHIYADCLNMYGRFERLFLFDSGEHIEIDIGLALTFAKSYINRINEWLENHPVPDFRYETKVSSDEYGDFESIEFSNSDLLESDLEEDEDEEDCPEE